jgi:hypothetical protein
VANPTDVQVDLSFPDKGLDRSTEYQLQPAQTTPDGTNVRAAGPEDFRQRGGSRAGLSRYIDQRVGGLDSVIQHLNVIVDPTSPAVLGSFENPVGVAGGDPDSTDPGIPDPSTNNLYNITGDPLDRRVPTGGRTVPTGGGGGPPVRNKPTEELVGDRHLYINSYQPFGTEFAGIADDLIVGLAGQLDEWTTFTDEYPTGYDNGNGGLLYQGLPIASSANGSTASISSSSGSTATSEAHRDATYDVQTTLAKRLKVVMARGYSDGRYEGLIGTCAGLLEQNIGSFRTHTIAGGTTGNTWQAIDGGTYLTFTAGYLAAEATDLATGYTAAEAQTAADEFHVLWVVWFEYDLVETELNTRFPSLQPEVLAGLVSDRITVARFRGTLGDGGIDASYDAIYDYVLDWIAARL